MSTELDMPVPPSVNVVRRINKAARKLVESWYVHCDKWLMATGQYRRAEKMRAQFEVTIVLCEAQCRMDLDNPVKSAIDYLRRIELISDDDKRYMRKVTIEWGHAPKGCRIILKRWRPE